MVHRNRPIVGGGRVAVEIERKFLVDGPVNGRLPTLHDELRIDFEQIYLHVSDAAEERVRRRTVGESVSYQHAYLNRIRPGVREVIESDIGDREYEQLRGRRDPRRQVIRKERTCFVWCGRLFELDNIVEPVSRACLILEVQISDERDEIELPDFLEINREVTMERQFANSSIALG